MLNEPQTAFLIAAAVGVCVGALVANILQAHPTRRLVWRPAGLALLLGGILASLAGGENGVVGGWVGCGCGTAPSAVTGILRFLDTLLFVGAVGFALLILNRNSVLPNRGALFAVLVAAWILVELCFHRRAVGE